MPTREFSPTIESKTFETKKVSEHETKQESAARHGSAYSSLVSRSPGSPLPHIQAAGLSRSANSKTWYPSHHFLQLQRRYGNRYVQRVLDISKWHLVQRDDGDESNLGRLNEMLDSFDVPEEDVIDLCGELTESEKATVLAGGYKGRMASALNVSEMVRAVNNLGFRLSDKLVWINESSWFTRDIDYGDIAEMIRAASNAERAALKTDQWKSFFVGVCTNETMITALDDLRFDLETKLSWLYAEMTITSWELDYLTIQPWVTAASQGERDALKTDDWKGFFVDVCTNETMVKVLNDLGYDLETKLTWLHAEMTITSWELDYATIKPWITAASQWERDALKTDTWRDFFVAVCTNATITNALDDLNFDLLTAIRWLLEETSVSNVDFTWLCNKFKSIHALPAGEDTIACAIMERDIRDGNFDTAADHRPAAWATRAHNQALVATEMGGMVGETAKWKPSNPASGTTFQIWASAPVEGPLPPLNALFVLNCWEMVMLAAYRSGVLSWLKIHNIYTSGAPDWFAFLVNQLSFSDRIPYNSGSPAARPVTGDIVFFDGADHIALAAGSVDGLGRTEIYSFWPPPNTAFTAGGTIDDVKLTTIEELNVYWVGKGKPAFKIEFATPNW